MELRFEDLPNAVSQILSKLERIENLLQNNQVKVPSEPKVLTVEETARFLHVTKAAIYGMIHSRVLPVMKPTKRCYFLKSDLINYLKEGRTKTYREIEIEAENYLVQRKMKRK